MRLARLLVIPLLLLGFAPAVFAQGCVMCYTSAAAQGSQAARSLDLAIMVILFPALLLFVAVLALAFRRRNAEVDRPAAPEKIRSLASGGAAPSWLRLSSVNRTR